MKNLAIIAVMFLAIAAGGARSDAAEKKILVAYFSHTGNTEAMAKMISNQTGGDLFRVQTVKPYPTDIRECINVARVELDSNARPELSTPAQNMAQYDVIFVGYPNWWATIPMAMFTFLEGYDMSGKTIIPFSTHNGSGFGSSVSDIVKLAPNSTMVKGLAIPGTRIRDAGAEVEQWLKSIGF